MNSISFAQRWATNKVMMRLVIAGSVVAVFFILMRQFGYHPSQEAHFEFHPGSGMSTILRGPSGRVLLPEKTWRRPRDWEVADLSKILQRCDISRSYAQECLEFLQQQEDYLIRFIEAPNVPEPPRCREDSPSMLFHMYWKGMNWTKHVTVAIKSFLYSQPRCAQLWIWVDSNFTLFEQFGRTNLTSTLVPHLGKMIQLKRWNTTDQLDTIGLDFDWKDYIDLSQTTVAFSDMVRFVVLHNYGGVYVDADVIFLRDMRPLYNVNVEFSGQWGFRHKYNTAVLRMFARGPTARLMLERSLKNGMKFHPFDITDYAVEAARGEISMDSILLLLPTHIIDPLWVWADGSHRLGTQLTPRFTKFEDAARTDADDGVTLVDGRQPEHFFTGAFLYHTHNFWNVEIEPKSWLGSMHTEYDRFLCGKRTNSYGESTPVVSDAIVCQDFEG